MRMTMQGVPALLGAQAFQGLGFRVPGVVKQEHDEFIMVAVLRDQKYGGYYDGWMLRLTTAFLDGLCRKQGYATSVLPT